MSTTKDLVKVVDGNRIVEVKNKDILREVLAQNPPKEWVKTRPYAKDVKYLPIDKVESTLDAIFQDWRVEIKQLFQLAQSICAVIRLHYRDPVTGEWTYHDGTGAVPLKTDKGASAADLSKIKSDAVATGAPAAVSFAIKDAADHLGNIFGRNLNRHETVTLPSLYSLKVEDAKFGASEEDRNGQNDPSPTAN